MRCRKERDQHPSHSTHATPTHTATTTHPRPRPPARRRARRRRLPPRPPRLDRQPPSPRPAPDRRAGAWGGGGGQYAGVCSVSVARRSCASSRARAQSQTPSERLPHLLAERRHGCGGSPGPALVNAFTRRSRLGWGGERRSARCGERAESAGKQRACGLSATRRPLVRVPVWKRCGLNRRSNEAGARRERELVARGARPRSRTVPGECEPAGCSTRRRALCPQTPTSSVRRRRSSPLRTRPASSTHRALASGLQLLRDRARAHTH